MKTVVVPRIFLLALFVPAAPASSSATPVLHRHGTVGPRRRRTAGGRASRTLPFLVLSGGADGAVAEADPIVGDGPSAPEAAPAEDVGGGGGAPEETDAAVSTEDDGAEKSAAETSEKGGGDSTLEEGGAVALTENDAAETIVGAEADTETGVTEAAGSSKKAGTAEDADPADREIGEDPAHPVGEAEVASAPADEADGGDPGTDAEGKIVSPATNAGDPAADPGGSPEDGTTAPPAENRSCVGTDADDADGAAAEAGAGRATEAESAPVAAVAADEEGADTTEGGSSSEEETTHAVAKEDASRAPGVAARLRQLVRGAIVPILGAAAAIFMISRSGGFKIKSVPAAEETEPAHEVNARTNPHLAATGVPPNLAPAGSPEEVEGAEADELLQKIARGELVDMGNGMFLPRGAPVPGGPTANKRRTALDKEAERQKKADRIAELRSQTHSNVADAQRADKEIADLEGKGMIERMFNAKAKPDTYVPMSDDDFIKMAQSRFKNRK
eukprot:CAMPEP_0194285968 /NCGR_PEP_ID=MMETSP0169-20130528/31475_1 /TAXON_ID=218684 /ORGANISM="Corethron pennatum, Strain L29A3" /LENGTH=502 /DNA_ID=CAMNT_0039032239 /DNA_START=30 /DNA_END=1538 /DNA_ORIENTATION=+